MKCPDYALVRFPASELTKPFSSEVSLSGTLSRFKRQKHTTLIVEGPLDAIWHSLMTAMLWDDWQWGKTSILVTEIPFLFFISLHHKMIGDSFGVFFPSLHPFLPSNPLCSHLLLKIFWCFQSLTGQRATSLKSVWAEWEWEKPSPDTSHPPRTRWRQLVSIRVHFALWRL